MCHPESEIASSRSHTFIAGLPWKLKEILFYPNCTLCKAKSHKTGKAIIQSMWLRLVRTLFTYHLSQCWFNDHDLFLTLAKICKIFLFGPQSFQILLKPLRLLTSTTKINTTGLATVVWFFHTRFTKTHSSLAIVELYYRVEFLCL